MSSATCRRHGSRTSSLRTTKRSAERTGPVTFGSLERLWPNEPVGGGGDRDGVREGGGRRSPRVRRRHGGARRSREIDAGQGADGDRSRPPRRGEGAGDDD